MRQFRLSNWWCAVALLAIAGCHNEKPEDIPLLDIKIGIPDKFYDVQAFDQKRAVIVGYAGKILRTSDGGMSWEVLNSGTNRALYSVEFVDDNEGWISGQDGLIIHTTDGGKTWERQVSGTILYIFAIDFLDHKEGWAVADKATYLHTTDGGKTWRQAKLAKSEEGTAEEKLIQQDPILYDIQFVDKQNGWIVGEFGKIYHTSDGGVTWAEQEASLMGAGSYQDVLDLPTFFGVHFTDKMNGLVAGLEGRVARTRDGGQSWKFEEFDVKIPVTDPLFRPFQFPDTTGWAVGAVGEILRQSQRNQPWQRADMGGTELFTWLRGVDFVDKDNGWIVRAYGTILHTTDGGKTWLRCFG